jgi:hypothetical protein
VTATDFITEARSHVGYRASGFLNSSFGAATGYNGQAWDGSFLELCARRSNHTTEQIPPLTSTAAAMQRFVQRGDFRVRGPQPGDIAFFAFAADGSLGQMHAGLVTSTRKSSFTSIEGQADPRRRGEVPHYDWVVEVERYPHDVIGFGRPVFQNLRKPPIRDSSSISQVLRPSNLVFGTNRPAHVIFQLALRQAVGLSSYRAGVYDEQTAAATREFERTCGYVHGDGKTVDEAVLAQLGLATGIFRVS